MCIEHIRLRPGESVMQSPVLPSVYDGMTCLPILDIRILSGHGYYPKENDVRKRNCTALSGMREKKRKPWRFPDFPYASLFFILRLEKGKNAVYG